MPAVPTPPRQSSGLGAVFSTVPPPLLFLVSGITQYLGAAIATGLFDVVGAPEVAWLRIAGSALVLLAWRRPWRRRWTRRDLLWAAVFGIALCSMNVSFYIAIQNLALGPAVAIEFLGPVAVAAITGRGWRERGAIVVATSGVLLLTWAAAGSDATTGPAGGNVVIGLIAIALAAAFWAAYIVLGRKVAVGGGITSLSVAMTTGALVFAPALAIHVGPIVTSPRYLLAVFGIAVFSSVIPYGLEQVILRRVSTATFSVMLAMLPATATLVGAVVLRQVPTPLELVGLVLVSGAIAMTARRASS